MFEALYNLLCELGLGPAARPLCDLVGDLTGESMSLPQLQQEILSVLRLHGCDSRADEVIGALVQFGFAGISRVSRGGDAENENASAAGALAEHNTPGASEIGDSAVLASSEHTIVAEPRAARVVHDTARGWLDIDGGIYFDVRQHGAGSDSER
jgi:hypothetical protein